MEIKLTRFNAKKGSAGVPQGGSARHENAEPLRNPLRNPSQVQCGTLAEPLSTGSNEPTVFNFAEPIFENYLEKLDEKNELNLSEPKAENKKVVFENGFRIALNRSIAVDAWGRTLRVTGQSKYFLNFQTKTGPVVLSRTRASEMLSFGYLHFAGGIWRQTFNTLEAMKDSENLYLIRSAPYAHVKTIKVTQLMQDVAEVFGDF